MFEPATDVRLRRACSHRAEGERQQPKKWRNICTSTHLTGEKLDFVFMNSSCAPVSISSTSSTGNVGVFQLQRFAFYHSVSVAEYLAETEAEMAKTDTGEFLFDDLRELAASHAQQKLEFEKLIPESVSLGLFLVRNLWIC